MLYAAFIQSIGEYRLKDYDYSFLVISKSGPLTDEEATETAYLIKTQIRAAFESSLANVQKMWHAWIFTVNPKGKHISTFWCKKLPPLNSLQKKQAFYLITRTLNSPPPLLRKKFWAVLITRHPEFDGSGPDRAAAKHQINNIRWLICTMGHLFWIRLKQLY